MEELQKLSLPLGLKINETKKNRINENQKQKGGNKFLFTNEPNKQNKQNKVNDILDLDIPLSKNPSKIDSYMIKDIFMI